MTVRTTKRRHVFQPGSAMATEAVPFPFLEPASLKLTLRSSVSVMPLVRDVDYAVIGDGPTQSGSIRPLRPFASGEEVEVLRQTAVVQDTQIKPQQPFPALSAERTLDRAAMALQEAIDDVEDTTARALMASPGEVLAPMGPLSSFRGKAIGLDAADRPVPIAIGDGQDPGLRDDLATGDGGLINFDGRDVGSKLRDTISIRDGRFAGGAKGDYLTNPTRDDTNAIQACFDAAARIGATVVLPAGFYRVTRPLTIGEHMFGAYLPIIQRTVQMGYEASLASRDAAAYERNRRLRHVSLRWEGAVIVADIPDIYGAPVPVLEYNIPHQRGMATITGSGVITVPARVSADGYLAHDGQDGALPDAKHIGFACNVPSISTLQGLSIGGLRAGMVLVGPFWMGMRDIRFDNCEDALHLFTANGFSFDNVQIWEGRRGLIYDGDGASLAGFKCQQVVQELTVISAAATTFGPGWYLEDVGTAPAATAAMRFAPNEPNMPRIVGCTVRDVHVGSLRPGKWPVAVSGASGTGINFHDIVDSVVGTAGMNGDLFDAQSVGRLVNCNGAFNGRFPRNRFQRVAGPTGDVIEFEPTVSFYAAISRPNQILPAIPGGTLAAGATVSGTVQLAIPQTKPFSFFTAMPPTLLDGGDPRLIVKITAMTLTTVSYLILNPTGGSITYPDAFFFLSWTTYRDMYA